jgi:hypothetical protein
LVLYEPSAVKIAAAGKKKAKRFTAHVTTALGVVRDDALTSVKVGHSVVSLAVDGPYCYIRANLKDVRFYRYRIDGAFDKTKFAPDEAVSDTVYYRAPGFAVRGGTLILSGIRRTMHVSWCFDAMTFEETATVSDSGNALTSIYGDRILYYFESAKRLTLEPLYAMDQNPRLALRQGLRTKYSTLPRAHLPVLEDILFHPPKRLKH